MSGTEDRVHALLGGSYRHDPKSGEYYNVEHRHIAELIHEYNHRLTLSWIEPSKRSKEDIYPFALVHTANDGRTEIVCTLREDELPLLLERVYLMDTTKHDVLSEIDAHNLAITNRIRKEQEETRAQAHDFLYSFIKSPKHTYKHDGRKFDK